MTPLPPRTAGARYDGEFGRMRELGDIFGQLLDRVDLHTMAPGSEPVRAANRVALAIDAERARLLGLGYTNDAIDRANPPTRNDRAVRARRS